MGWGDAPGASSAELSQALAQFDPAGLAQALGRDEDHSAWFADVCDALLPDYAYSLGADTADNPLPLYLPVIGAQRQPALERQLPYPPGWERTGAPTASPAATSNAPSCATM
jgi:hypothetical protein